MATTSGVVRHRHDLKNEIMKKAKKNRAPTRPCEKITNHRCPWVPSGGTPQALQSGVDAPAMEAKLPWTSRVLPNPMTGDPLAVLDTVWVSSWLRRSLLCACSSRSEINRAERAGDEQQHADRDEHHGLRTGRSRVRVTPAASRRRSHRPGAIPRALD